MTSRRTVLRTLLLVLSLSRFAQCRLSKAQYFFMLYPGCASINPKTDAAKTPKATFSQADIDTTNDIVGKFNNNYKLCNFANYRVDDYQLPRASQANTYTITATDAGCNDILLSQCPDSAKYSKFNSDVWRTRVWMQIATDSCIWEIVDRRLASVGITHKACDPLVIIFNHMHCSSCSAGYANHQGAIMSLMGPDAVADTLIHEIGHYLNLGHADTQSEYGDKTCRMGTAGGLVACFNAPHSNALGWSRPTSVVDHTKQPRDVWLPYNVPFFSTSANNHVVVNLKDAKIANGRNGAGGPKNYNLIFLSVKSSKANPKIDQGSWSTFGMDEKLLVHLYDDARVNFCYKIQYDEEKKTQRSIDMQCPSDGVPLKKTNVQQASTTITVRQPSYLANVLDVGQVADFPDVKVKIMYVSKPSASSSGIVKVCIYTESGKCSATEHFQVHMDQGTSTGLAHWKGSKGLAYASFST